MPHAPKPPHHCGLKPLDAPRPTRNSEPPFLGASILALGVALLAVIIQTLRAAQVDPATTLRDE